ncbi:MAG: hypothetical protein J6Q82_08405 [Clostridia bacterium]|nr:hypothetical protein [Clostridia bacterium]
MKQEQTIDDILKMLKDSVSAESTLSQTTDVSENIASPLSEEMLKVQLQKQYGDSSVADEKREDDPYALDDGFLQEAIEVADESEDFEALDVLDETEEFTDSAELEKKPMSDFSEGIDAPEEMIDENDLPPWEELSTLKDDAEPTEDFSEEALFVTEEIKNVPLLALDYVNEDEEELTYEILPKLAEEEQGALILRNYSTEPVPVNEKMDDLKESEASAEDNLLSGLTYATPALNPTLEVEEESAYDLMCQFGCEDEWKENEIPKEELQAEEEETEYKSYAQTEKVLASYRKKKIQEIVRLCGVVIGSILLFFYETLPMFGVPFTGLMDYHEYIGAYLLIGFQILLICTVIFGKRMAQGALRLFSLRPNFYSLVALAIICTGVYDVIVLFTVRDWIVPFHFISSLLLVLLAVGEYLMLSREIKAFSVVSFDPERKKYTLRHHDQEDPCVQKMKRGGLSEDSKVAVPEVCEFPHKFFASIRNEEFFGTSTVSFLLIPSLLLAILSAVVTILLHLEISVTLLTAMSVLMAMLPMSGILAVCFPLWISSERLWKRQTTLMGRNMLEEIADIDVLVFEDVHLFRQCTTTDTGISFYEKSQTATILGCLECLYATIGGPLAGAFSNIPEEYRFDELRIRRLIKGGVEVLVDRKHILLVGDVSFMNRYGLSFPAAEEKTGRTTVYISLNGKISAKMSVRYQPEPIFEMLAERMDQNGIQCVIKTFDPMISAAMVSAQRSFGNAPISVVHQTLSELNTSQESKNSEPNTTAVLAVASRFKLVEAVIWSKMLLRIHRTNRCILSVLSILGVVAMTLLIGLEQMHKINQYWFVLWGAIANVIIVLTTLLMIPKKKYFSVDACHAEWQKKQKSNAKK